MNNLNLINKTTQIYKFKISIALLIEDISIQKKLLLSLTLVYLLLLLLIWKIEEVMDFQIIQI